MYADDDLLMISGIQHYAYCQRQWGLIHLENQWESNIYTALGDIAHEKVDDPFIVETRGELIVSRSVPLRSYIHGCYGIADLLEYRKDDQGIPLEGREGLYKILPVEYKVGKPKEDSYDLVQLCLQGLCLEEMFGIQIDEGAMYYAKTRRRVIVKFDKSLRDKAMYTISDMHQIIRAGITPTNKYSSKCDHCSLYNVCLPKVLSKKRSVASYIHENIEKGEYL